MVSFPISIPNSSLLLKLFNIVADAAGHSKTIYPFQLHTGLFIFLSFAVSGRALELYRSKVADILKDLRTKRENNKQSSSSCDAQSTNITSTGNHATSTSNLATSTGNLATSTGNQDTRQIEDTSL